MNQLAEYSCASNDGELCQFAAQFDTPTPSHHRERHAGRRTRRLALNSTVKTLRFVTDPSDVDVQESTKVNVDDSERTSYTLGERQDRVLVATSNEVTITSTSEPLKTITFNTNRWAHFINVMASADEEAKELNRNTRPIVYRQHLGDGYYVSVTGGVMCVDFRKYYVPYGLPSDHVRPTKSGISLRLDEWANMIQVIPTIHATFPELATAKRCVDEESHLTHLNWLQCTSCFPFGH